ncbi:hypothetical protein [uncultured Shimia sp.]|uniref:hypothetical protein n=1 Tax=uncultured Shimia sp. TaxID=573152 RepID=UPI00262E307F|nr:hypothetical protein [uncultured Shimia sp.]
MANTSAKIEGWLPYALPVLGGLLGVVWVNIAAWSYINPVIAVVVGALLGRVAAIVVTRAMRKSRRKGP